MKNTIEIKPDQENELYFNVAIEGTSVPNAVSIRMICEGENFDYSFRGIPLERGEIKVIIPPIPKGNLHEGKDYNASLEVLIDNKKFVPIELNIRLPKTPKVTAEMVTRGNSVNILNEIQQQTEVTAALKTSDNQVEEKNQIKDKKDVVESIKRDIFKGLIKIKPK